MAENIVTKTCPKCKTTKPLSQFGKDRSRKDGFTCWCKSCQHYSNARYQQTEQGKANSRKHSAKYRLTEHGKKKSAEYVRSENGKTSAKKGRNKWYETKGREWCRAYMHSYRETPTGKEACKKGDARYAKTEKHKQMLARHRNQLRARCSLAYAVRSGKLPRPASLKCSKCGKQAQQYHHWSYERLHWRDVISLCRKCHFQLHHPKAPILSP